MTRERVGNQGWDHLTELVDGEWIERTPLESQTVPRLRAEVALMGRLAPRLPLAVPVPVLLEGDPPTARHRIVPGDPIVTAELDATDGEVVGRFLRALHDTPPEVWDGTGIAPDADQAEAIEEMARDVLPLLPAEWRSEGRALVDRVRGASAFEVLRHSDLGPEHLLTTDGRVSGIIDWTDVALGDPALDLSWLVCRTPTGFADALVAAYRPTGDELARGRDWNLLAPWWEVRHGLRGAGQAYVESGLDGAVERLRES